MVFIDCINVKIREGQVANRPIYMALAVTAKGHRDILGLWAGGEGGEGAKHWLRVLTELKNRGVEDVLMLVCDGLKGLPDAVGEVWPKAVVQTCVVHLLRASFRYAARQDWDKIAKALKPVYTAPTEDAATTRFLEFSEEWGQKYPAIVRLGENAWASVRAVPAVRRGDPADRLHHQRHRVRQRPHPPGRQSPRPLPLRERRPEMRLPRRDVPRSDRHRTETLDQPLEAGLAGLRHRLRRPSHQQPNLTRQPTQLHRNLYRPVLSVYILHLCSRYLPRGCVCELGPCSCGRVGWCDDGGDGVWVY